MNDLPMLNTTQLKPKAFWKYLSQSRLEFARKAAAVAPVGLWDINDKTDFVRYLNHIGGIIACRASFCESFVPVSS